jgi:ABC-type multidrug transport system fused ATPase/permease subunit
MAFIASTLSSIQLLDSRAKKRYFLGIFIQSSLSILDILGVLFIGLIALLATQPPEFQPNSEHLIRTLRFLQLDQASQSDRIFLLGILTFFLFVLKTLCALTFSRILFRFLANKQSELSSKLLIGVLDSNYLWSKRQDPHQLSLALIAGMSAATVNALGQLVLIFSEVTLVLIFFLIIVLIEPVVAFGTLLFFTIIIYLLNVKIGTKVQLFNSNLMNLRVESQIGLFNVLSLFREIRILNRQSRIKEKLDEAFSKHAFYQAEDIWIQQFPKYILELSLVVSISLILLLGSIFQDGTEFIPLLAIYLGGASRLFPSLLRIQSAIFSLRAANSNAQIALEKLSELNDFEPQDTSTPNMSIANSNTHGVVSSISLKNLDFCFPGENELTIRNVTFDVNSGERLAIIGPSGSGKSTLCDILLGLISPTGGEIQINGLEASIWFEKNRGAVAYVPQEIRLIPGTILENICLGLSPSEIDANALDYALEVSQLKSFIRELPEGLQTNLLQEARNLSGGQRQRIGIARAIYTKPTLIVLDEATSALDVELERSVLSIIRNFDSKVIVILVAHGISAIQDFPRILYLENGSIKVDGNFQLLTDSQPQLKNDEFRNKH